MSEKRDTYIIELAGLPGSGKTTVSNVLVERLGVRPLFFAGKYNKSRYKLWISLPFVPLTIGRFHRVFIKLIQAEAAPKKARSLSFVVKLLFQGAMGWRVNPSTGHRTLPSILSVLNGLTAEYWLATLEASIRRKRMIWDGGFVQRGIAVWLRAPQEIRADLWDTYISHLPRSILCIVLECEPDEALRRAKSRQEGVPKVLCREATSLFGESWLIGMYKQMSKLLMSKGLTTRVKCIYISADMDADEIVDRICAEVEATTPLKDLVVQ